MHMENTQIQKQGILYASCQNFPYRNESPMAVITTLASISVLDSGMQYDEVGAINEIETEQNPITDCFSKNITPTNGLHVRSAKCSHNQ